MARRRKADLKLVYIAVGAFAVIAFVLAGRLFVAGPQPEIVVPAEVLTKVGPLNITNTLLTAWVVMAILVLGSLVATRSMKLMPSGFQNFVEAAIGFLLGQVDEPLELRLGREPPVSGTRAVGEIALAVAERGGEIERTLPSPQTEAARVPEPDEPGEVVPDGAVSEVAIALAAGAGSRGQFRGAFLFRRRRRRRRLQRHGAISRTVARLAHDHELGSHYERHRRGHRRVDVLDEGLDIEASRVVPPRLPLPEPHVLKPRGIVLVIPPQAEELLARRHALVLHEESGTVRRDVPGIAESNAHILEVSAVELFENLGRSRRGLRRCVETAEDIRRGGRRIRWGSTRGQEKETRQTKSR